MLTYLCIITISNAFSLTNLFVQPEEIVIEPETSWLAEKWNEFFSKEKEPEPTFKPNPLVPEINPQELQKLVLEDKKKEVLKKEEERQKEEDRRKEEEKLKEVALSVEDSYILPDPRLLPHSIFKLKCRPGVAFHQCVQLCLSGRSNKPKIEYKAELKDVGKFQQCVEDCRDVYLNTPGKGCMDSSGNFLEFDKGSTGDVSKIDSTSFKWRAWIYRVRNLKIRSFMTRNLNIMTIVVLVGLYFVFSNLNINTALFYLLNEPINDGGKGSSPFVDNAKQLRPILLQKFYQVESLMVDILF